MKVRAVAAADERCNAIGTLELECTELGLVIDYLGVGAFSEGYAPAALTHGTRITVPWADLVKVRVEGEYIYLETTPELSPHNRMLLKGFSVGDASHEHEVYRQRLITRIGAGALAVVAAIGAGLTVVKASPESGALMALLLGALASSVIVVIGFVVDKKLVARRLSDLAARDAFVARLVPYFPALDRASGRPPRTPRRTSPFELPLPRGTFAVVATLTAGALATVLVSHSLTKEESSTPHVDSHPPAPKGPVVVANAPPVAPPRPAAVAPPTPKPKPQRPEPSAPAGLGKTSMLGPCDCQRADSALWVGALPKLSVLVLSSRLEQTRSRKRLLVDIAVVNNSKEEFNEITLHVNFYERKQNEGREFSRHRVLFFEGPLLPGKAIKWSAEAPGNEFELENPVAGDIGLDGGDAAPRQSIVELLEANHRPVRLHGAMLLAYLGDARARDAVLELRDALRDDEAPYLRRVQWALEPVRVCQLQVAEDHSQFSACVFNASAVEQNALALVLRALASPVLVSHPVGNPPEVVTEKTFSLPGPMPGNSGVRVKAVLSATKYGRARAFEAVAAKADQLP